MQYDERADGGEIDVTVPEEFEISLPETRTAGYRWQAKHSADPVVRLLEENSLPNTSGVGGTGRHVWRFQAVSAGTAELEFHYHRPWEASVGPARTFRAMVRVRP